ncbi:Dps family protein [Ascidiimonas aurantiaca]|uniref:Dps family protein n=1 Tax=Ascidiimonas aurantiaca TaxID=1685432 RepID=UPI0030EF400C
MTYLNLNEKKLVPVVGELNKLLADYSIYYQNLRGFHWNILGKNFFDLHEKFEELYNDAKIKIDEIAERILTLRYHPVSKYSDYLKISSISEDTGLIDDREMVKTLLTNHGNLLNRMRETLKLAEDAGDEGTIDMMGSYIASLEKSSWMLDAWIKKTTDQLKQSGMVKTS